MRFIYLPGVLSTAAILDRCVLGTCLQGCHCGHRPRTPFGDSGRVSVGVVVFFFNACLTCQLPFFSCSCFLTMTHYLLQCVQKKSFFVLSLFSYACSTAGYASSRKGLHPVPTTSFTRGALRALYSRRGGVGSRRYIAVVGLPEYRTSLACFRLVLPLLVYVIPAQALLKQVLVDTACIIQWVCRSSVYSI